MSSIETMQANVLLRLGEPVEQKPSDRIVLLNLSTQIQSYINEANLSAKPWVVAELDLNVSPNTEDYPIPATDFGKPLMVRTVWASNPAHIERTVDFFELQDLNFDWNLPKNFGNTFFNLDGSPHTALRMAFFRKSGLDQAYVRVLPVPQLAATYQILYQIGKYGEEQAVETVPVLPQHHALIEVRTAISLLPMAQWSDDAAKDSSKRGELAMSLKNDALRLENEFQHYIATVAVSRRLSYRNEAFAID